MKLLRKTFGAYILVALPVFVISMGGFYFFLKYLITQQVDASLKQDKQEITEFVNNNKNDVTELYKNISCSYYLKKIPKDSIVFDKSRFIAVYDSVEQEYEPIRELRSSLMIKGKNYAIILQESFVESDSLIYSIASFALILFIILTLGISLVQVFIARQIWKPFKKTLRKISRFKPGLKGIPEFEKTPIAEFTLLNEALSKMIDRINTDFELQKKFIDNVSHELQTPISVLSAQIELLIQEIELKESSAGIISIIEETLYKMKRVNKALLLLSKIENEQFLSAQEVDLDSIIKHFISSHEEQFKVRNIHIETNNINKLSVNMNLTLAEILIGNLLSNSVRHNIENGEIKITITQHSLYISNTGNELATDPMLLFNKYTYSGNSAASTGLGLSIVKEICNRYGFTVIYTNNKNVHTIQIDFVR